MTSFDEPGRVKREGILTRLLRFLGIGASAEDEQERARLAALNLNMAVYADLFANESEEILVLTSDFEAQAGTFRINANIGNGKKQFQGKTRRLLAYIDPKSGTLQQQDDSMLTWEEDYAGNPIGNINPQTLRPLTVYRVRVRHSLDFQLHLLLLEVLESDAHNQELENLRREYLNPVLFTHPLATFRLNTFMENFEAKAEWAGLPVKLSLNAEGDKPAGGTLKRLSEVFAQQTQLYSTLNTYLLENIRKHNGIRTKDGFFPNPHPTAESFLQDLKLQKLDFFDQDFDIVFHNDDDALIPDGEYYFYVSFDTKGNITGIESIH